MTPVPSNVITAAAAAGLDSRERFATGDLTVTEGETAATVALMEAMKAAGAISPIDELLDRVKGAGGVMNTRNSS